MNESIIIGPANKINWLMVAAFRYAVNRHTTQAMYGIDEVILNNLDVLNTVFIEQFINAIEHEQYVTELDQERRGWETQPQKQLIIDNAKKIRALALKIGKQV